MSKFKEYLEMVKTNYKTVFELKKGKYLINGYNFIMQKSGSDYVLSMESDNFKIVFGKTRDVEFQGSTGC